MWNCYDFRDLCTGDMVTVRFIQYFNQDDLADSLTKEPLGPDFWVYDLCRAAIFGYLGYVSGGEWTKMIFP